MLIRSLATLALPALALLSSCKAVPPEALSAAEAWLALVDSGQYAQSWTEAAPVFKAATDTPGWERSLNGVRAPLGKVLSRTVNSSIATTKLPGAPDGEYVVVLFDTSFEHKQAATETVTPMKDQDGRWRVSGYYIR